MTYRTLLSVVYKVRSSTFGAKFSHISEVAKIIHILWAVQTLPEGLADQKKSDLTWRQRYLNFSPKCKVLKLGFNSEGIGFETTI